MTKMLDSTIGRGFNILLMEFIIIKINILTNYKIYYHSISNSPFVNRRPCKTGPANQGLLYFN